MWSPVEHSASTVEAIAPMPDAERQRLLGALQLGHGLLERPHGRVGVAAVEVAGPHPGGPLAGVVESVGLPRAGAPQRAWRLEPWYRRPAVIARVAGGAGGGLVGDRRRSRGGQASRRSRPSADRPQIGSGRL